LSNNADICDHLHHFDHLKTGPRILHISHTSNKIATLLAANGGGNDIAALKRKPFK